jgi:hypothetical protein
MDQLCINQFNNQEVNQETPKMRQYYGNAKVTLITINTKVNDEIRDKEYKNEINFIEKILKTIVNSE